MILSFAVIVGQQHLDVNFTIWNDNFFTTMFWANYTIWLNFSLSFYKIGLMRMPISEDCCKK